MTKTRTLGLGCFRGILFALPIIAVMWLVAAGGYWWWAKGVVL
jgi:hypothetical protein